MQTTLPLLTLIATLSSAHGAVLLSYEFTGGSMSPTSTADAGLLTGGAVTNANLGLFRTQDLSTAPNPWAPQSLQTRPRSGTTNLQAAITNNIYFSITLNPQDTVNLTELAFGIDNSNVTYPSGLTIRSSVTGTTNLFTHIVGEARSNPGYHIVDLTDHDEFEGLESPVTFQFYIYQPDGFSNVSVEFDNITFSGSAVPEPGAPILLGCAATMLMFTRRRKG